MYSVRRSHHGIPLPLLPKSDTSLSVGCLLELTCSSVNSLIVCSVMCMTSSKVRCAHATHPSTSRSSGRGFESHSRGEISSFTLSLQIVVKLSVKICVCFMCTPLVLLALEHCLSCCGYRCVTDETASMLGCPTVEGGTCCSA
jgi:hypothetical protein